mmetsp:Transcript_62176/g.96617  ORF Transcript_62176/g.96617 Transcript_62176/m.96617 type:complete len:628 (-) Transcript_62176:129-2012(-)
MFGFGTPMIGAPMIGAPMIGAPMVGPQMMSAPMVGAPVVSTPMIGAPMMIASAPVVSAPVVSTPMIGAPMMTAPVVSAPMVSAPMGGAPMMGAPAGILQGGMFGVVGGGANISTVKQLLDNRDRLKKAVIASFKRVSAGRGSVDMNGLAQMRMELASTLAIPETLFGPLEDQFISFDFDGSGNLQANEVYKLVKFALYDYLKASNASQNSIPFKSKEQAGIRTIKKLGEGNQASVDLVIDQAGQQRCLKTFNKSALMNGAGSLADLQDEYEAMQLLACKNIAKSYEIFQDQQFVYMVNEVYLGGDMTSLKQKATMQVGVLTEDWWKGVFRQCFEALQFMHQQAMMHCDVKEPNMMLRTDNYAAPQVVLIDFGISKAMTKSVGAMVSGTPGYMPPETMNTGKWFPGGDVFSLGVAIYQLLTDQVPDDEAAKRGAPMIGLFLNGATTLEDVQRFVNTRQPDFFRIQMPGLRSICQRCLEKNMRNRPRAPALIKDNWFSGMAPGTAHFYNTSTTTQAFGQAYSAPVATYSAPPVATYSAPAMGATYSARSYCPPPVARPVTSSYAAPMTYSTPVVSSYAAPTSSTLVAPSLAPAMTYAAPPPVAAAYATPMVPSYAIASKPSFAAPAVIV